MIFVWDPGKAATNFKKHGIGFEEASTIFLDTLSSPVSIPNTREARSAG